MSGWTLVRVRSEPGRHYLERAVAAGALEPRDPNEDRRAQDLLVLLAAKQRARVRSDDPHDRAAHASEQAVKAARPEEEAVPAGDFCPPVRAGP